MLFVFSVLAVTVGVKIFWHTDPSLNFLYPPDDLYEDLATLKIDLSATSKPYVVNFEHKYPGNHRFDISVEIPLNKNDDYCASEYEIRVDVFDSDKLLVSKNIYAPCGERGIANLQVQEERYVVPRDLPLREPLRATITVIKPEQEFSKHHGKAVFEIKKSSDI